MKKDYFMHAFKSDKEQTDSKKIYTYSFLNQWRESLYIIAWIAIAMFLLTLSQKKGAVIFLSLVSLIIFVTGIRDQLRFLGLPWKLITTDEGIIGVKRNGQRIEMRWEEIQNVKLVSILWCDIYPFFLLETRLRLEKIGFSPRINDCTELIKIINKKAINCKEMEFFAFLRKNN